MRPGALASAKRTIEVDYLARVEGETAIRVVLPGGAAESIELKVFEPPRFFEGFLLGRRCDEVPDIVARICGICPVSHMTTAIRALEQAMGVEPTPQTAALREISCLSQIAASHLVHLYALALPDYMGAQGLPDIMRAHPDEVVRLVRMREVLNDLTALVAGGRALHPIGTTVGGFTRVPSGDELSAVRERLIALRPDAEDTVRLIARLSAPVLDTEREFCALHSETGYAINGGRIVSSNGMDNPESEYETVIAEEQVPYAMAKRACIRGRGALMVGALARLNLKYDRLAPRAKAIADEVRFRPPNRNPFHNNLAQAIEVVHATEECIDRLAGMVPKPERRSARVAAGEGAAITEAPRGLLYHSYAVNRRGLVERANIATPTVHNFLQIEQDLRDIASRADELSADGIRLGCEMLVRAYDPCFSCSVH
jgi:coenzyme F420-reducing hydrogenase alpha subunit